MRSNEFRVPEVFAVMMNGTLHDAQMRIIDEEYLKQYNNYFVKEISGECASFVKHINSFEDFISNRPEVARHNCIFQKSITQDFNMNVVNRNAINTLRIVTVYNNGNPYVFSGVLRVGTKKTDNVDNWAKGGLVIGINENGRLKEFGYYKPGFGTKTDTHPDSNIKFSEFIVPQWEQACKVACNAHKLFYNIKTIGWDIAITPDGPEFIEGNDNWEISLNQVVDCGLKEKWKVVMETN